MTHAGIDGADLVVAARAAVVAAALAVDDAGGGARRAPLQLRGLEVDGLEGGVDGDAGHELGGEEDEDVLGEHFGGFVFGGW